MNNYCIILAGGVGRRLWPNSTQERPKQFCDFFGTGHSMLQMTYDRFRKLLPADHIVVSTHTDYVDEVRKQLPELPVTHIVTEDVRLSTAPAAAYATRFIQQQDADACVIVTPSDQMIVDEDTFLADVRSAFQRLRVSAPDKFLALAVQATHPYTSYGYIQKGESVASGLYHVKTFTEKPDREFAEMFVQSDEFLWNTGLFLWHVDTMTRLGDSILEEVAVQQLDGLLLDIHRQDVLVQECRFGWTDVGCWPRMYEVSNKDVDGNVVLGSHKVLLEGCSGTTVAVAPGNGVIVKGLKDYLVAFEDGVLVIIPNKGDAEVKRLHTRFSQM